jgi:hypothetical protein
MIDPTYTTIIGTKIVKLKGDLHTMKVIVRKMRVDFERTGRVEFPARHAYYGPLIKANVEEGLISEAS